MAGQDGLSIAEAADRLGVHYMTAYRYVRVGRLLARKEGREWRIPSEAIERFLAGDGVERTGTAPGEPSPDDRARRLLERLLAFDEQGAWQVIESVMGTGVDAIRVHTELTVPALREVGERWTTGRLDVAQEHGAVSICRNLVGRLSLVSASPGVSKGVVVFACPAGEGHQIATTIAADIFRASGFDVVDCGGNVPLDSFAELVARTERLAAVGISLTLLDHRAAAVEMVAAVRGRRPDATVIVGGGAVGQLDDPSELGADHVAETALEGVACLTGSPG